MHRKSSVFSLIHLIPNSPTLLTFIAFDNNVNKPITSKYSITPLTVSSYTSVYTLLRTVK